MSKNKNINITPSKGINIVIKNDIVQPLPPKPKKKRRYKRINIMPKSQVPILQTSTLDTSYIKEQPGRFSLWRDTTTATPVLTLAQATSQGFIPGITQPIRGAAAGVYRFFPAGRYAVSESAAAGAPGRPDP